MFLDSVEGNVIGDTLVEADEDACQFCNKSVKWGRFLSTDVLDRLQDLELLRGLNKELRNETSELLHQNTSFYTSELSRSISSSRLKKGARELERTLNDYRIKLAEKTLKVENQKLLLASLRQRRENLQRECAMKKCIKEALVMEAKHSAHKMKLSQFEAAIRIFRVMNISIDEALQRPPQSKIDQEPANHHRPIKYQLRGCSSISGIPLPNSGNYTGAPVELTAAALAHIAHLVESISKVLRVTLQHAVRPFDTYEWASISPHSDQSMSIPLTPAISQGQNCSNRLWTPFAASWRLAFSDGQKPEFSETDWALNTSFPLALLLLQSDIVALCLQLGVEASDLWPPEGLLLNLLVLEEFCKTRVAELREGETSTI